MAAAPLRIALLAAGAGAVLVLTDLLGTPGAVTGAALIALGALFSAPARRDSRQGLGDWWPLLAAGALLAIAGVPIGLWLETPGGLLAGVGATLAVAGVALGLP